MQSAQVDVVRTDRPRSSRRVEVTDMNVERAAAYARSQGAVADHLHFERRGRHTYLVTGTE